MYKDKYGKRSGKGRLSIALASVLLVSAMLTGCGGGREDAEDDDERDYIGSEEPESGPEEGGAIDMADMAGMLADTLEGDYGYIDMRIAVEIAGTVVTEDGRYPVKYSLGDDIDIAEEGAKEFFNVYVTRDGDGYESVDLNWETIVLTENGSTATYTDTNFVGSVRTDGDGLKAKERIAGWLDCLGGLEAPIEDDGYGDYKAEAEVSGEALRRLLVECGGLEELGAVDGESISGRMEWSAYSYMDSDDWTAFFAFESDELASLLLSSAYGVTSVENGTFSMRVDYSCHDAKNEYLTIEKPEKLAGEGATQVSRRTVADMVAELLDEIYAKEREENFVKIEETTDPVTIYARGAALTIAVPGGLREEGKLEQDVRPDRARLVLRDWEYYSTYRLSHGVLIVDFRIASDSPEEYLQEKREDYLERESKGQRVNGEISDNYALDTALGKAAVMRCSYSSEDEEEKPYVECYIALPLPENGKVLFVEAQSMNEEKGCDDDTIKAILSCCAIGEQAPAGSGDSSAGSQSSNAKYDSVEEFVWNSEYADTYQILVDAFNGQGSAGTVVMTTEGDSVVYTFTLNPPPAGQAYDLEFLKTSYDEIFSNEENVTGNGMLAAMLQEYVDVEDPKIIWRFCSDKGEVFLTKEYGPLEGTFTYE